MSLQTPTIRTTRFDQTKLIAVKHRMRTRCLSGISAKFTREPMANHPLTEERTASTL